jgi:hypothetical protein
MFQINSDNNTKKGKKILRACENMYIDQLLRTTVDIGHDSNQIKQHKKYASDTRVHAKIGKLCELQYVSNQSGPKKSNKTLSAKCCNLYL